MTFQMVKIQVVTVKSKAHMRKDALMRKEIYRQMSH